MKIATLEWIKAGDLRFEAVSGRPVYVTDRVCRAAFVSSAAREYEDEMAQWRIALGDLWRCHG
jgi:hypothetical protein